MLNRDADDFAMLLDIDCWRFSGRADNTDAVGSFGDMPVNQAAQSGVIDAAVLLHRCHECNDAAN